MGLMPFFPGGLLEGPGPEEAAVVGEGQRRHLELLGPANQVRDPVGSVQEGVFGVGVKVDEGHGALVGSLGVQVVEMYRPQTGGRTIVLKGWGRGQRGKVSQSGFYAGFFCAATANGCRHPKI